MIFKNKKNNQIANITSKELVSSYINDECWEVLQNYRSKTKIDIDYEKSSKIFNIKEELKNLSEDIIQSQCGEIVPNLEDKKKKFVLLHNGLRELEGKTKREVVDSLN